MKRLSSLTRYFLFATCLFIGYGGPVAAAQVVEHRELNRIVEQQLTQILQDKNRELVLEQVYVTNDVVLPDGVVTWQVDIAERSLQPGRQMVHVTAMMGDRTAKEMYV